jgi:coenzyme F420-reducing hydrogenase delta subunit
MGIEPGRIKLVWASAAEGVQLAAEITKMVEEIRALGPLDWPKWDNGHLDQTVVLQEEVKA